MLIRTLAVGPIETNCYIVTDRESLQCAVIDPGFEATRILEYIEREGLKCTHILLTHAHFDHVSALPELMEETGATLYMSERDCNIEIGSDGSVFTAPAGTVFVNEGDEIAVGSLKFKVLETPGHTPGCLCYICEDALFSGDTLFNNSCGRTDFASSSTKDLMASLYKLCQLTEDYEVFPGHMSATSLAKEKRHNYYMLMACSK